MVDGHKIPGLVLKETLKLRLRMMSTQERRGSCVSSLFCVGWSQVSLRPPGWGGRGKWDVLGGL